MMTDLMRYDDLRVTEFSEYEKTWLDKIQSGAKVPLGGNRLAITPSAMDLAQLDVPNHGPLEVLFTYEEITIDDDHEFDGPQLIAPIGALQVTLPIDLVDNSFIVNFHVKLLQGGDVFYIPCRHIHTEKSETDVNYYLDVSTALLESLAAIPADNLSLRGGFHYADEVTVVEIAWTELYQIQQAGTLSEQETRYLEGLNELYQLELLLIGGRSDNRSATKGMGTNAPGIVAVKR